MRVYEGLYTGYAGIMEKKMETTIGGRGGGSEGGQRRCTKRW